MIELVRNKLYFAHSALGDMACIFRLAAARGDVAQAVRIRRLLVQHLGAIAFVQHCFAELRWPFDPFIWSCPRGTDVHGGGIRSGLRADGPLKGVAELRLVDERADVRLRVYVRERTLTKPQPYGQPPVFEVLRVLHDGWP